MFHNISLLDHPKINVNLQNNGRTTAYQYALDQNHSRMIINRLLLF